MVSASRSLSEDDLPLRRSEAGPRNLVAPESRTLLGHPEALGANELPGAKQIAYYSVNRRTQSAIGRYKQLG